MYSWASVLGRAAHVGVCTFQQWSKTCARLNFLSLESFRLKKKRDRTSWSPPPQNRSSQHLLVGLGGLLRRGRGVGDHADLRSVVRRRRPPRPPAEEHAARREEGSDDEHADRETGRRAGIEAVGGLLLRRAARRARRDVGAPDAAEAVDGDDGEREERGPLVGAVRERRRVARRAEHEVGLGEGHRQRHRELRLDDRGVRRVLVEVVHVLEAPHAVGRDAIEGRAHGGRGAGQRPRVGDGELGAQRVGRAGAGALGLGFGARPLLGANAARGRLADVLVGERLAEELVRAKDPARRGVRDELVDVVPRDARERVLGDVVDDDARVDEVDARRRADVRPRHELDALLEPVVDLALVHREVRRHDVRLGRDLVALGELGQRMGHARVLGGDEPRGPGDGEDSRRRARRHLRSSGR
mmetsp:Transcript_23623/g.93662  ORF Transcript_23623/g.93662 Transcript_23623/m.93662 type:complete len:414 (+) Transcript_23623:38-1279(+)